MWLLIPSIDSLLISVHSWQREHNFFPRCWHNKITSILQITFSTYFLEWILMPSYANSKLSVRQHWFRQWFVASSASCHHLNQCCPNLLRHICAPISVSDLKIVLRRMAPTFIHVYGSSVFIRPVLLKWIHSDIRICPLYILIPNYLIRPVTPGKRKVGALQWSNLIEGTTNWL